MKQFLEKNTITYNLMSFTGFKAILIFSLLLESPKSYKEIQNFLENHEYLHEKLSVDALRIYINSLKEIGCNVVKKKYNGVTKYSIDKHPFCLNFDEKQVKNIIKVYKAISSTIDVADLIALQKFFRKISEYIDDDNLKRKLVSVSPLNNIDEKLINDLISYIQNNNEITVYYNSPNSGRKNITILPDRMYVQNGKLYIAGLSSEHENYSSFLVSRIIDIVSVNIKNKTLEIPNITVRYEYIKDNNEHLELLKNETCINSDNNKLTIEITSKNKFEIFQRIMYHSSRCKVLYPEDFKGYILSNLKQMKERYIEK